MKLTIQRTLALLISAAFLAGSAVAKKDDDDKHGNKHGNKHEQKHQDKHDKKHEKEARKHNKHQDRDDVKVGAYFNDDHRHRARAYYVQHYPQGRKCPPGLAKKNNGCMPPGQVKHYVVGQPLPRTVTYYPVPQPVIVQLPVAPPGYRYLRVGNDIILVSPQSQIVVDVIAGLLG